MRDFIWEGVEEGKGFHLFNWEVVGRHVNPEVRGKKFKVAQQISVS